MNINWITWGVATVVVVALSFLLWNLTGMGYAWLIPLLLAPSAPMWLGMWIRRNDKKEKG